MTPASAVLAVRADDPVARARGFSTLVSAYWKPVYKCVRIKFKKSNEEAKDLTQSFFVRVLERDVFSSYDPGRARFRTFIRVCLRNFVTNEEVAARRLKRGGESSRLSLDYDEAEAELVASDATERSFEEQFDEELTRSLHALGVAALRDHLASRGKEIYFRVFERYDLVDDPDDRPTYAALAAELELKATDVTNYLHAARRELRRIILAKLREITASEEEFREEAQAVLGVDAAELA